MHAKGDSYFKQLARKSRKEHTYAKVTDRLLYILAKLDARRSVSTRELAHELDVTARTIQRDIEIISSAGFPVYSKERGVYTFVKGFSLKKVELTKEQAALVSFMHEIARSLGGNFESSFKGLLQRVMARESDSPFYAKIPEGVKLDEKLPFVKQIESAIEESLQIKLVYLTLENKEKSFQLNPFKIAFYDGFWYLVAQVAGKDTILTLRLERIKQLHVSDDHFIAPENLKTMLEQSVNIWFPGKRNKKVLLKVDKEVAHFFKQKTYFPLQEIKEELTDGSLLIETTIAQDNEVILTVKHWIPYITVEAPAELAAEVKRIVVNYLKKLKKDAL